MTDFLKTPRETMLEEELRIAKAELAHYKGLCDPSRYTSFLERDTEELVLRPIAGMDLVDTLRLTASWRTESDERLCGRRVIGRAYDPSRGIFQIGYFVTDAQLYSLHDRLNVLGAMHTNVMKQIVGEMKRERGQ